MQGDTIKAITGGGGMVCEADIHQACRPYIIVAIPSQTYKTVLCIAEVPLRCHNIITFPLVCDGIAVMTKGL